MEKLTAATRSRFVPSMVTVEPADAGLALKPVTTGFTRVRSAVTVLPLARCRVSSPSWAASGTVAVTTPSAKANSAPAALGKSRPVTRSRSEPARVTTAPFFTGAGVTPETTGTTVVISPARTATSEAMTMRTSPSVAVSGSTKVRVDSVATNSVTSAPSSSTFLVRFRLVPLMVTASPAL